MQEWKVVEWKRRVKGKGKEGEGNGGKGRKYMGKQEWKAVERR